MNLSQYLNKTKQDKVSRYFITRKYLFLEKYLKCADKPMKALDIGSNYGLFTELLKNKGYDAFGIDVDKEKVGWAKKNCNANYKIGSAEKIPFKDNEFDVILLLATLEHIIDRATALKEINRVLKPEGKLIITVPNTASYFFIRSFLTYSLRGSKPWKNVHYQQNYFHWEHQIHQFVKIVDSRPILFLPFAEPKILSPSSLSNFEYTKGNWAWASAEPIFICTKRKSQLKDNTDTTLLST